MTQLSEPPVNFDTEQTSSAASDKIPPPEVDQQDKAPGLFDELVNDIVNNKEYSPEIKTVALAFLDKYSNAKADHNLLNKIENDPDYKAVNIVIGKKILNTVQTAIDPEYDKKKSKTEDDEEENKNTRQLAPQSAIGAAFNSLLASFGERKAARNDALLMASAQTSLTRIGEHVDILKKNAGDPAWEAQHGRQVVDALNKERAELEELCI